MMTEVQVQKTKVSLFSYLLVMHQQRATLQNMGLRTDVYLSYDFWQADGRGSQPC